MINNIFKRKKQLAILFLLIFVVLFSGGQDTLVRKKYLDSVKNQLAIYTVTSYTHLNLYDKAENEKIQIQAELDRTRGTLNYIMWRRRRENLNYGIAFIFLMGLSFFAVTRFN